MTRPIETESRLVVGRVRGVFGVKGWIRIESFTHPTTRILDYSPWLFERPDTEVGRDAESVPVQVIEARPANRGLVAQISSSDGTVCDDRDAAMRYVGYDISVPRSVLPDLDDESVYWIDLIGLTVETTTGESLGRLKEMLDTGAHDVMVVDGERERLIPFVRERFVRDVDLQLGRVVVDWDPDW